MAAGPNPDQADDNVGLVGTLAAGGLTPMRFEGIWEWVTLAGVRNRGTFRASER